jgi:hypothetical protein
VAIWRGASEIAATEPYVARVSLSGGEGTKLMAPECRTFKFAGYPTAQRRTVGLAFMGLHTAMTRIANVFQE